MPTPETAEFSRLLDRVRLGGRDAASALLPAVYGQLRALAQSRFAGQRVNHTLQPTALVHEAWIKLAPHLGELTDERHFLAVASRAMRQVLTDHARKANRLKRGSARRRVTLDEDEFVSGSSGYDLIDLDDVLTRLATLNERHARMVELRVFAGLTIDETAEELGVSHGAVERDWFSVRGWLRRELLRAN